MNETELKNQTKYAKARLGLMIGMTMAFVLIMALLIWREYSLMRKKIMNVSVGFKIERVEFEKLWLKLTEKTKPVEVTSKIRYGGDIGKLEPFE